MRWLEPLPAVPETIKSMLYVEIAFRLQIQCLKANSEASRRRQAESNQPDVGIGSFLDFDLSALRGVILTGAVLPAEGRISRVNRLTRSLTISRSSKLLLCCSLASALPRSLRCSHLIGLPDQVLQLVLPKRVQPIEHDPVMMPQVRGRPNIVPLNQLRKSL